MTSCIAISPNPRAEKAKANPEVKHCASTGQANANNGNYAAPRANNGTGVCSPCLLTTVMDEPSCALHSRLGSQVGSRHSPFRDLSSTTAAQWTRDENTSDFNRDHQPPFPWEERKGDFGYCQLPVIVIARYVPMPNHGTQSIKSITCNKPLRNTSSTFAKIGSYHCQFRLAS